METQRKVKEQTEINSVGGSTDGSDASADGSDRPMARNMYRYYTETRGDIFMPRGEAEGQKYINPSCCVIPDIYN